MPPEPTENAMRLRPPKPGSQHPPNQPPAARTRRHKPAEVAANEPPPPVTVSAIGQLSSGDPANYLRETENSIRRSKRV